MKIVYLGSGEFGIECLDALSFSEHDVRFIVTQPPNPAGRGRKPHPTQVAYWAEMHSIPFIETDDVNASDIVKKIAGYEPDLIVVIAFGQKIGAELANLPPKGSINVHSSLLPKYRGAAPINWAIINGDTKTGLSIIKMEKAMDSGPIILQKEINISQADTAISLEGKLADIAARLLLEAIHSIEKRNYILKPQDDKNITFAPKLKKEDGQINWEKSAIDIFNLIKGVLPWPGAFTYYNDKLLKIYRSQLARALGRGAAGEPGQIIQVSKEGIIVETGKDNLIIEELQIEGKRRMPAEEFIAGHKISPG